MGAGEPETRTLTLIGICRRFGMVRSLPESQVPLPRISVFSVLGFHGFRRSEGATERHTWPWVRIGWGSVSDGCFRPPVRPVAIRTVTVGCPSTVDVVSIGIMFLLF